MEIHNQHSRDMSGIDRKRGYSTKRQRSELARKTRENRRRALRWVAGAAITGTGLFIAHQAGIFDPFLGKPEVLTGEIDQTKRLLFKWDEELDRNSQLREKYLNQTKDLAIIYFSRQMGYDPQGFKDRVDLVSRGDFVNKFAAAQCEEPEKNVAGFFNPLEDKTYVNKNDPGFMQSSHNLKRLFIVITHELFHLAPPKKQYSEPIQALKVPKPVVSQKGLASYSLSERNPQCLATFGTFLEEAVVQDATSRLTFLLGFEIPGAEHRRLTRAYRERVLVLYGGNHRELLAYQQKSDSEGFFRSVGERIESVPGKDKASLGAEYLIQELGSIKFN